LTGAANHYLILCPTDPEWVPASLEPLVVHLQETGFMGAERRSGVFSTGADYLSLITYLGCAPEVALGAAEAATLIRLNGPFDRPQFRSHPGSRPRCPACRGAMQLEQMRGGPDEILTCRHCGTRHAAMQLDWRHQAGLARFFIDISNVFEAEAVPGEALLDKLGYASGQGWDYFYWQAA
jgi:hypothetical protein